MSQLETLENLVNTLEIQSAQRADYIVPTNRISMVGGNLIIADTAVHKPLYALNEVAHGHIREKLHIPADYYRRMQAENINLLDANVTSWMKQDKDLEGKSVMVRTFESNNGDLARGILSDRYAIIDNFAVLETVTKVLKRSGLTVEIKEATVTDKRMYLNITAPNVEINAEKALRNYLRDHKDNSRGFGIVSGLTISNSEVGFGKYSLRPRAFIIRCGNGLIVKDDSFATTHLGAQLGQGLVKPSKDTQLKNLHLIEAQTRDAVKYYLSRDYLKGIVQKIEVASQQALDNPVDTVQNVVHEIAKNVGGITETRKQSILNTFINSGDRFASGVFQALTYEAKSMNADDRNDLETEAFAILPKIKNFDKAFKNSKALKN